MMLKYEIQAVRIDQHGSRAISKQAELIIDTDVNGLGDAFDPAELFLSAMAACILKNIERVAPMIHFDYRGVSAKFHGVRQASPPKMVSIDYDIVMDTGEKDHRLARCVH